MRPMPMALGFLAAVLALALAEPASAVTRHASPTGVTSGSNCTDTEPACSLERAVEQVAVTGDLVLIQSGDYSLADVLLVAGKRLDLRAENRSAAPRVVSTASTVLRFESAGGSTASDLQLEGPSSGVDTTSATTPSVLERLTVTTGPATGGVGVALSEGWILRDSVVRSTAPNGVAVRGTIDSVPRAVNVTAIASDATGIAFQAYSPVGGICVPPFRAALNVTNAIARGGAYDLSAPGVCSGGETLNVSHSNFNPAKVQQAPPVGRVNDLGGNQSADPLFAGPLDFHQLAGSPTIDGGVAVPQLGGSDQDGDARTLGAAPDVGADEFRPPPPPPVLVPSDTSAPLASLLSLNPATFRALAARASQRRRGGTRISYALTEAATTRFTIERAVRRRKRTRYVPLPGSFNDAGEVGGNSLRFYGRLSGRRLRPGRYRLTALPTDAAENVGNRVRTRFRIRR